MSKPLEVRAITSFGAFRIGNVYEVDIENDSIMALLGVGYLEPTSDLEEAESEEDDDVRLDRSPELGVGDSGLPSPVGGNDLARRLEAEGVADGADRVESGSDTPRRTSARVRGGKAAGIEDADRGEDSRSDGNA